jgi:uncharacterized protein
LKELLEFLTRALVEEPDEVRIEEFEEDGDVVFEVTVAEQDLGRVIGKGGRMANALRAVTKAAATKADVRVMVEILD